MSKNKKEKSKLERKSGYTVVNLSGSCPPPSIPTIANKQAYPLFSLNQVGGWINYGVDNLFPQTIIALNNESALNKAIIENKVTYVCGKGVRDSESYHNKANIIDSWDVFIEKLTRDYVTFGGFCFQVILNKDGQSRSLYHTDFSKTRIGAVNEFGVPLGFFLSNDWTKTTGNYSPTPIKAYDGNKMETETPYLFYFKDYEPNLDYYPIPSYYAAFSYIEADGLLGKFYRNSINNGFTPSVIVTIPSNPSEEVKEQFNKDMTASFAGTNGANSIVVLYGESQDIKPDVTPFVASDNADVYNAVNDIVFQKIVSAHSLTSPTLAGLSGSGSLSGNANEIINSFILYNATVIKKIRRKILDAINPFVVNNGYEPLVIEDLDIAKEIKGGTQAEITPQVSETPENTETK